ncbi:MAG: hypothetical protein IT329_18720 [Caldilineaceae bacterium]|nr:hypothetical protein [Caldilineaceae bacterium]
MQRYGRWAVILVLGLAAFSLAACETLSWRLSEIFAPPPGEGRKAERGYAAAAPVIDALAAYQAEHQRYPATLDELIPSYLPAIPQPEEMPPLSYTRTDQGYQLAFQYVGPGMNRCTYTPAEEWDCMGYY